MTQTLDLRGLKCPMPALRTRKGLKALPPQAQMEVLTTDPMAAIDVPLAVQQNGGRVIEQHLEPYGLRFRIVKV